MAGRKRGRRGFGSLRQLPSGRWQARCTLPDGSVRKAPLTFDAQIDAEGWLVRQREAIVNKTWMTPAAENRLTADPASLLFWDYAQAWLATRPLATTTRNHYAQILRDHLKPTFGALTLTEIGPVDVRSWHASLKTGPTARSHAYALLRSIMATAVADDVIPASPCRIRGAGASKRVKQIRPASLAELETIAATVPGKYKMLVLLAAWCALRFGELAELRRSDIDVKNGIVHVRRGVVRVKGEPGSRMVKDPKTQAGIRDVNIPPHLMPALRDHLGAHTGPRADDLLFPSAGNPRHHLAPASLYRVFYPARKAAGREDLRFHDLRHTGAVLAAATGATLAELMARLGHTTADTAMRYQHAAADRDKAIAEALSKLATVTPITAAKTSRRRKEASS